MTESAGGWQRLRPRTRRFIRAAVLWLLTGTVAATWGAVTATYQGAVGPHSAQYSTTLNDEITFDLGPLGALIVDSPLPLHLGVDIEVGHIPAELTPDGVPISGGDAEVISVLTTDLQNYTQFFTNPDEAITTAARGLAMNAVSRTVLAWSILLTGVTLGRLAAHGVLRDAFFSAWRQPGVPAVAIALALVGTTLTIVPATEGSSGAGVRSAVLAGTPIEDARITGRLRLLVDHYGQFVIKEIEKNQKFYDDVTLTVISELAVDPERTGPVAKPLPMPTVTPLGEAASATEAGAPEEEPTQEAGAPTGSAGLEDLVTIMVVSDLHCNIGMGEVAGVVADVVEADMIVNLGDTVLGGTSVEGYCINSFAQSFKDLPVVVADGNHDSRETSAQERAVGWHVLDGSAVDIDGIRFLGDSDPTFTSLGAPTRQVGDENSADLGARLAQVACAEAQEGNPVDILLVHNHRSTEEALNTGCVKYSMSGHFHRRIGPWQRGLGVQYVHTSSAGAQVNMPTIGPLSGTAGITVMTWDRAARAPVAMRVINAHPNATIAVSPWYSWPDPAPTPVHHEWPTLEEAPWE